MARWARSICLQAAFRRVQAHSGLNGKGSDGWEQ
jgi:hypothetical protein